MVRYSRIVSILWLMLFLTGLSSPVSYVHAKDALLLQLQQRIADPQQKSQAMSSGEERALLCGYCHGADGNSIRAEVPNLADQNPEYLLQQINRFASGERKDFVMNSLASTFSDEDQINLVIYYSNQKVKAASFDKDIARQGEQIYLSRCQGCHGENGRGKPGYARLAGQNPSYIKMTLERFRDVALGKAKDNKRRSPIMEAMATKLTDSEINKLAAYITSM